MSSQPLGPLGEPPRPVSGVQTPRIFCAPEGDEAAGTEAADFLGRNGLILDPWQRLAFEKGLAERDDGQWAAFEVVLTVGRQNGKTLVLAAREIAGLFLFGEELIVHTAHQWKTAHKSFMLVQKLIRKSPDLMSKVRRFSASPGQDVVLLKDGRTLEFIARTKASGLGWSAECVVIDEAFDLVAEELGVLMPTLSAMPNPQIWYASSAAKAHSEQLFRLRERGLAGDSRRFCYMEWSAPENADPTDPEAWAQANPALGHRISEEFFENEQRSLPAPQFGRECLGWPDDLTTAGVFSEEQWNQLYSDDPTILGPATFGVAVSEDREWACVAVAGARPDGFTHVEYGEYRATPVWVVDYLADLASRRPVKVVVRPSSEAGSLIYDLEQRKIDVVRASMQDYAQFCGNLLDSVAQKRDVRHSGQAALDVAVRAAQKRRQADAFVWEQRNPHTDICPLEAVTLAFGQSRRTKRSGRLLIL